MQEISSFDRTNLDRFDFAILGRRGGFAVENARAVMTIVTLDANGSERVIEVAQKEIREIQSNKALGDFYFGGIVANRALANAAATYLSRADAKAATGKSIRI